MEGENTAMTGGTTPDFANGSEYLELKRVPAHYIFQPMKVCPAFRYLVLLVVLLQSTHLPSTVPASEAREAWVKRYSNLLNNGIDQTVMAVTDSRGDVIVAGYTDRGNLAKDFLTIKFSGTNGSILWERRYNGPLNGEDEARGLAVDSEGNVIVTGVVDRLNWSEASGDYCTIKYAAANGVTLWEQRYNGPANDRDEPSAVAVDSDGNAVVTGFSTGNGSSRDFYTAKYRAADGVVLWEQRYNGPGNGRDEATALALDANGNVVVGGMSRGTGAFADPYVAKYSAVNGGLIWAKRPTPTTPNIGAEIIALTLDADGNILIANRAYSSVAVEQGFYVTKHAASDGRELWRTSYPSPAFGRHAAKAIAVDGKGNLVLTGITFYEQTPSNALTVKFAASNGALLWQNRFDGPAHMNDGSQAVAIDPAGNALVTGYSESASGDRGIYTAKYAAESGALLWEQRYQSPENFPDSGFAVATDQNGDVIITGTVGLGPSSPYTNAIEQSDSYTAKYSTTGGQLLWELRYNGEVNGWDSANAVAVGPDGNPVVTGFSQNNSRAWDFYTAKHDSSNGSLIWEKRHSGYGPGGYAIYHSAMALDSSGNVVIAGSSVGTNNYPAFFFTAKYASQDGALLWEKYYGDATSSYAEARAVAADKEDNVVATGRVGELFYTAKYAAKDGALIWEKRYNGGNGGPAAVAVDLKGNAIMTASSEGDVYTAKYAAADGKLLWDKRYPATMNERHQATALAVDAGGNVVVTGSTYSRFTGSDFLTLKFAAATGGVIWERRYDGPISDNDYPTAVVVDRSGDVFVTGFSMTTSTNSDFHTLKYSAGDGATLWERRYDSPSHGWDGSYTLKIDPSGNVVISGHSMNERGNPDIYTAKYASADGALLWERQYASPRAGLDYAAAAEVDLKGNVFVTGYTGSGFFYDIITIKYDESPPQGASIFQTPVSTGFQLGFPCQPGQRYAVQRAEFVAGPWTTLAVLPAPSDGYLHYTDGDPRSSQAFYRLTAP
jgi:uncharacterized delta-60 repeat protein